MRTCFPTNSETTNVENKEPKAEAVLNDQITEEIKASGCNSRSFAQWMLVGITVASVAATTFGLLAHFAPFEAAALISAQTGFHIAAAGFNKWQMAHSRKTACR